MKNRWWSCYGDFRPAGDRPDIGDVLLFYKKRQNITNKMIAQTLHISERAVQKIFQERRCFDNIKFLRSMQKLMSVPGELLGLDSIQRTPCWWQEDGYTFPEGEDGYPLVGAVIKFFREKRGWTQSELGQAFERPVNGKHIADIENNRKGMESMERRTAIKFLLGIGSGALLGLQDETMIQAIQKISAPTFTLATQLPEYRAVQNQFFAEYYQGHAQDAIQTILNWIKILDQARPHAKNTRERLELLEVLGDYHKLYTFIKREQRIYTPAFDHANTSIILADTAVKEQRNPDTLDKLALALFHRSEIHREAGNLYKAKQDIEASRQYSKHVSTKTQCRMLMEQGTITSLYYLERGESNAPGLKLLDSAAKLLPAIDWDEMTRFDEGFLLLRRVQALDTMSPEFSSILEEAKYKSSTSRRNIILSTYEAEHLSAKGNHRDAATLAVTTMSEAKAIRSKINRDRLEPVYKTLLQGPEARTPEVARLGLMLQTW